MSHIGILFPQAACCQKEINSLYLHVLSRRTAQMWAFTSKAMKPARFTISVRSFPVESIHSNRDIVATLCISARKRNMGRNVHAMESDGSKAVVQKSEYTGMPYQFGGTGTNSHTSIFEDTLMPRNNIPKISFNHDTTQYQGYENPSSYSTLKLNRNVLNFFHASHALRRKARLGKSQMSEFENLMDLGTVLLKEGEQGLDGRLEVAVAARMLREAGARFASASAIDPSSLAAIDAWGITFLAHGKLKLFLTEKLRDMLREANVQGTRKDSSLQSQLSSIEGVIPKECEECEKLLVEAGRKFGMAMSMDQKDDLALFNWGLALFYRARLIAADDLEDSAQDADKIYMAAIEKFKATSKFSQEYSGAAFLSWGLALRDQSWLHHSIATEERIKLLERARWTLEQAIQAYPNSIEAKCAMEACSKDLMQLQNDSNAEQKTQTKVRSQSNLDWN